MTCLINAYPGSIISLSVTKNADVERKTKLKSYNRSVKVKRNDLAHYHLVLPLNPTANSPPTSIYSPSSLVSHFPFYVRTIHTYIQLPTTSDRTSLSPIMGNAISNFVEQAIESVKNTFRAIAPPIARYVVEHPIRTMSHLVSGVLLLAPGIITAPLLAAAGFASNGIVAGEQVHTQDGGSG